MTDSTLSLSDEVRRGAGVLCAEIDGETVALNAERGVCYGLDPVASSIWSMLEDPTPVGDLCARLTARYRVEPSVCERDVLDLLHDLRNEGLIAVSRAAAPQPDRT